MTKESSPFRVLDLPSEVLKVIGPKNLSSLSLFALRAAVERLDVLYKEKGIDWIREKKNRMISGLDEPRMF